MDHVRNPQGGELRRVSALVVIVTSFAVSDIVRQRSASCIRANAEPGGGKAPTPPLRLSRNGNGRGPDGTSHACAHASAMVEPVSYAVTWAVGELAVRRHALLADRGLRLEGRDAKAREGRRSIRFDRIIGLELAADERAPNLVVGIAGDDDVLISSLDRPGSLGEPRRSPPGP